MAKTKTQFECQECGALSPTWVGKCSVCGDWNSLVEQTIETTKRPGHAAKKSKNKPVPLHDVNQEESFRKLTHIEELDRLLGNGFVQGSLTLLGGEPGIGKSTLSLQLAQKMAESGQKVLYVSGEESAEQIALRSKRLGKNPESLFVYAEVNMEDILKTCESIEPDLVILDSIQVVFHPEITAIEGGVSQVRHCANAFMQWIKANHKIGIIIGHITKEGSIAGPKVLEHMVDVILYLEGERNQKYRLLRSYKNRFASTNEMGVFEMKKEGLIGVVQPSELFIDQATLSSSGSVVAPISEGNRIFLVEVQALAVSSGYGMAKRNMVGVNTHRATLMTATIEKILGLKLFSKDIFLNIIGGIKVDEPALDLAIIMAILSSYYDSPIKEKIGVIGEVGLTGEVRPVSNMPKRLLELQKMGFTGCILPAKSAEGIQETYGLELYPVTHIRGLNDFTRTHIHHREASE